MTRHTLSPPARGFLRLHRWLYRRSNGRVMGQFAGVPVILLTTRGQRTGRDITVPLMSFEDGDRLVVAGAALGAPEDPQWCRNLRAHPGAWVQYGSERFPVDVRETAAAERERLWQMIVSRDKRFARHQNKSARQFPVFVLQRQARAAPQ